MESLTKSHIAAVLITAALLSACNRSKPTYTDTPTSGHITISVDESFEPIIQQEIDVFEGIYNDASIIPIYTDEVEAINLLLKDSVRLAVTTRKLSPEEKKSLMDRKLVAKEVKIATDGIALIVNKANKDTLITVDQIRKILTGEIKSWKQLNPNSHLDKLQLVFDNANSSTVRFAIDSICKGKKLEGNLNAQKTNEAVIDYVAKVPDAIGVIGVSWIGNKSDTTNLSFNNRVNVMAVSSIEEALPLYSNKPYQAYIYEETYPLRRNIYIITTDPYNGLATGFTTFVASFRGQKIILKTGVVPATMPARVVSVRENL